MCSLLILIIILLCFLFASFTRKSASSFFAAYDALCEEGTATPVCKALDEIADISVPGKSFLTVDRLIAIMLTFKSILGGKFGTHTKLILL
jgi:hypothetical protein